VFVSLGLISLFSFFVSPSLGSNSGFLMLWFIPSFLLLKLTVGPSLLDSSAKVDCVWVGKEIFFCGIFISNLSLVGVFSFLLHSSLSFKWWEFPFSNRFGLSGLVGMSSILENMILPFSFIHISGLVKSHFPLVSITPLSNTFLVPFLIISWFGRHDLGSSWSSRHPFSESSFEVFSLSLSFFSSWFLPCFFFLVLLLLSLDLKIQILTAAQLLNNPERN